MYFFKRKTELICSEKFWYFKRRNTNQNFPLRKHILKILI